MVHRNLLQFVVSSVPQYLSSCLSQGEPHAGCCHTSFRSFQDDDCLHAFLQLWILVQAGLELMILLPLHPTTTNFNLFFFFCNIGVWTQDLHLEPLHQHFFVMDFFFFEIGSHKLFAWQILRTASWVARITGVSHRCQALNYSFVGSWAVLWRMDWKDDESYFSSPGSWWLKLGLESCHGYKGN
jgi:hypothetical protein